MLIYENPTLWERLPIAAYFSCTSHGDSGTLRVKLLQNVISDPVSNVAHYVFKEDLRLVHYTSMWHSKISS
jgi:hypothetical protein